MHLNCNNAFTYEEYMRELGRSFVKDRNAPNIIPVGHAWDFKQWLSCREVDIQSWTDNHVYRFSLGADGHAQLHYKYFCRSPHYMCRDPTKRVESFKRLAADERASPGTEAAHGGIPMPTGIPQGEPPHAKTVDFAISEKEQILLRCLHH